MHATLYLRGALVVAAVVALCACAGSPARGEAKNVTITKANDGQTVDMVIGGTLQVRLEGNPTTGYTWNIVDIDGDAIEVQGEVEFESSSEMMGAGGDIIYHFAAKEAGQVTLKLSYDRPWETKAPEDTFEVTVVVR